MKLNLKSFLYPAVSLVITQPLWGPLAEKLDQKAGQYIKEEIQQRSEKDTKVLKNIQILRAGVNFVPVLLNSKDGAFCSATEFVSNNVKYTLTVEHCLSRLPESLKSILHSPNSGRISNILVAGEIKLSEQILNNPELITQGEGVPADNSSEDEPNTDSVVIYPTEKYKASIFNLLAYKYSQMKTWATVEQKIALSKNLKKYSVPRYNICDTNKINSKNGFESINLNDAVNTQFESDLFEHGSSGSLIFQDDVNDNKCIRGMIVNNTPLEDNENKTIKNSIGRDVYSAIGEFQPNSNLDKPWVYKEIKISKSEQGR